MNDLEATDFVNDLIGEYYGTIVSPKEDEFYDFLEENDFLEEDAFVADFYTKLDMFKQWWAEKSSVKLDSSI